MEFPASEVLKATKRVGVVYKFSAPEHLDGNSIPHYFVIIACLEDNNYLIVSTTQLDKNIHALNLKGISLDTLCYIKPSHTNGLTENSYLNCNQYISVSDQYLFSKLNDGLLVVIGEICDEDFEKIRDSISLSPVFDLPLELIQK